MKIRNLVLIVPALFGLAGCAGGDGAAGDDGRLTAVSTIGMITDLVTSIGGERVRSIGLMGPGIDPHLYKASEGDVMRLVDADVIFYNGLHLEAKLAELLEKMESRKRTVAVTADIPPALLLSPPEFEGAPDPHVWFDVTLWMTAARRIRDALVELDPEHADGYRARATAYLDEMERAHAYARERIATVPPERRVLITAHDAFNYFGRAYGIEVRGLQGISTVTEAGTADVQGLARLIAGRRIPALFVESSVPPRAIEAVQAAVEARGFRVRIGGELFSDAMGDAGTPEGTYLGMIRHNVDTIVEALGGAGEQPESGAGGRARAREET